MMKLQNAYHLLSESEDGTASRHPLLGDVEVSLHLFTYFYFTNEAGGIF